MSRYKPTFDSQTTSPVSDWSLPVLFTEQMHHDSTGNFDLEDAQVQPSTVGGYSPGGVDIFFLGISIVISGQTMFWNAGLDAGLVNYAIAYLSMGAAYVVFCCCIAEITGVLPFAGGSYGLTRCTLGLYMGFLIGCCEALEYIVYIASSVVSLGQIIIEVAPTLHGYQPLIWLAVYMTALPFHIRGFRPFWIFIVLLGVRRKK
ncbi:TPA: hypothetical protein N0F65_012759 [Lagenidium giganteum]|uniref:Amino acid permease/ SLC12A domain-containing protein n=1 Tax=Lagenidium giganteum TaxID=4803 RepID=A0AAV2YGQ9_9STRA|nr:TPA: hypothetical protein N0F65_012759 [Lagenidium giganteum]